MYFCRGTCPAQLRCVLLLYRPMSHAVASMCRAVRLFTFAIQCYLIPLTVKLSMYCCCYSGTCRVKLSIHDVGVWGLSRDVSKQCANHSGLRTYHLVTKCVPCAAVVESFYKKVEIYVHAHINVLFCYAILKSLL